MAGSTTERGPPITTTIENGINDRIKLSNLLVYDCIIG